MSSCDMCGKQATTKAKIEGTEMAVCDSCKKYGKELIPPRTQAKSFKIKSKSDITNAETVLEGNWGQIIRQARENKQLSQMMLARALAEKESLIQQVESGHTRPSEMLAKKLERYLNIQLYVKLQKIDTTIQGRAGGLTIGDLIKK